MVAYEVKSALAAKNGLGEGPLWHPAEQALYWVDIHAGQVQRFDPETGSHDTFNVDRTVTALGIRQAGGFIVATQNGFAVWNPPKPTLETIAVAEGGRPGARFNDGAVDPGGCFWAGTMKAGEATSSLYRLDPDYAVHRILCGLTVSNGLGWSPDGRTMYFTDSLTHTIWAFDFDAATGEIAGQRIFAHTPDEPGVPDGLAVDAEGYVWSVRCRGWKISRYDPVGRAEREILLPVECPTSCAFGGPDLETLYITTSLDLAAADKTQPLAGNLLAADVGIKGQLTNTYLG